MSNERPLSIYSGGAWDAYSPRSPEPRLGLLRRVTNPVCQRLASGPATTLVTDQFNKIDFRRNIWLGVADRIATSLV